MANCNYTAREVALANVKKAKEENHYELIKIFREESFCDFLSFCEHLNLMTEQIRNVLYWSSLRFEELDETYSEEDLECVNAVLDALGLSGHVFQEFDKEDDALTEYIEDEESFRVFVKTDCQIWTSGAIAELKKKYNIIYSGSAIHAIKIIKNQDRASTFIIGTEDDGCIYFDKKEKFSSVWASSLADNLQAAIIANKTLK